VLKALSLRKMLLRYFLKREIFHVSRIEREIAFKFNIVTSYSEKEVEYLHQNGIKQSLYLPLPLNLDRYSFVNINTEDDNKFLFMGDYKWFPNYESAIYILTEIFPALHFAFPDIELLLIGRNAPESLINLANNTKNVAFLGEVPDIHPYIEKVGFVLAPVLTGGGVRLKILESLAQGKVVITNSCGAEGIADQNVMIVEDSIEQMIIKLNELFTSKNKKLSLKKAAYNYTHQFHSYNYAEKLYKKLL
jgi:glycosyltransferase involved in cell wall biosynthesis